MFRKSAVAAALLFITASSSALALGLGEIDMQSALNQPMNAVIHLTSAAGMDLSGIKVNIASAEAHARAGLSRSRALGNFRFKVEQDGSGQPVVHITSADTIHEPFLEFILELSWPNGHLMRQYTVLIDPPLTMPATPAIPAPPVSSTPMPRASVVTPARPRSAQAYAHAHPIQSPAQNGGQPATSYGPIKRSETLWSIARELRPDDSVSIEQMMLALQRANPNAFINNNVNNLKAGVTLQIPSRDEIVSVSARDARAEFDRQYQEWKAGSTSLADSNAAQAVADSSGAEAETTPTTAAAPESAAAVITESKLQLTAPEGEPVTGAATGGDPQAAETDSKTDLEQQLALANEAAETSKAESEELQSRVTDLEDQVTTMKRLLELKDEELASIQNQQAAEAAAENEQPVTQAEEPEVANDNAVAAEESPEADVLPVEDSTAEVPLESSGIINKLMNNPLLAGLGVLVAILLGGLIWASNRRKGSQGMFDDEMTLEKRLAVENAASENQTRPVVDMDEPRRESEPAGEHESNEGDPLTEADVYLAYGRLQQAENVLVAALEKAPDDMALRLKLLEVYHAGGDAAAFDDTARDFRDSVQADDAVWLKVAAMGTELSPENELYKEAASDDTNLDFDIDLTALEDGGETTELSGAAEPVDDDIVADMDAGEHPTETEPESVEFSTDEFDVADLAYDEAEDDMEGLLDVSDEVSTKLDLARAYLDMGDPEGARSILDEVLEEGNEAQKDEAGKLIAEIA